MKTEKILLTISAVLAVAGCRISDIAPETAVSGEESEYVAASCALEGLSGNGISADTRVSTKAPVGQTSTVAFQVNFLKWDEPYQEGTAPETYSPVGKDYPTDWSSAYIVDATISSPQNNSAISSPQNNSANFRSVNMSPKQTYRTSGTGDERIGYISRMIGWHPFTYDVPDNYTGEGTSNALYDEKADGFYEDSDGVYVVFHNKLDLKTDVMMTQVLEGRVRLDGFKNNDSDREIEPFGHEYNDPLDYDKGMAYDNHFTFKHYLTAIRLFVRAEQSNLSLISWRQINNVVIEGQPSTVRIRLPETADSWGEAVQWYDYKDMSIVKDAMFDEDPGIDGFTGYGESASYPVALEDVISMDGKYLGYALVQPGVTIPVELHTDAGVFSIEIDPETLEKTSDTGDSVPVEAGFGFEAGCIYNIFIDIKTDDSINAVLENSDMTSFRNLAPYNDDLGGFEYSNCYVINTADSGESSDDVSGNDSNKNKGYYFSATVPGRGRPGFPEDTGLYPGTEALEPYSVQILWQSEEYLVKHAELVQGYVRFILNDKCYDDAGPLEGNAVLAVSDRSGNIIWSWHIWVVRGLSDIEYNIDGNIFSIMNMNLGATKAEWTGASDVLETYGLYYQWGRKDPSPGPPEYDYGRQDMLTSEFVTNSGKIDYVMESVYSYPTVEDGAKHPLVLISSSSTDDYPNDWLYYKVDGLWGYDSAAGEVTKKTIYDPCPYGYRVSDDELRRIFEYYKENDSGYDPNTGNGQGAIKRSGYTYEVNGSYLGHVYGGGWFPFAGWKGHDQGRTDRTHAWYGVGTHGDYQGARINSGHSDSDSRYDGNHRERNLILKENLFSYDSDWVWGQGYLLWSKSYSVLNVKPEYSTNITLDWGNRASAAPVRCVRYDEEPTVR